MPILNLPWTLFGRPIKPVSFVLMMTMLVIAYIALTNTGILGPSVYADLLGAAAVVVALLFAWAWWATSQEIAEWALLLAFFLWGFRFWAVIFVLGDDALRIEGFYLSFLWMLLSGGSWLLERSDPIVHIKNREKLWSRD